LTSADPITRLMIAAAVLGALVAIAAVVGKLSRGLPDRTVDRLYYVSYVLTGVSASLFVMRGLFGRRS